MQGNRINQASKLELVEESKALIRPTFEIKIKLKNSRSSAVALGLNIFHKHLRTWLLRKIERKKKV